MFACCGVGFGETSRDKYYEGQRESVLVIEDKIDMHGGHELTLKSNCDIDVRLWRMGNSEERVVRS